MNEIKFLADVNIEKRIVDYLLENDYDVKWIPDYDCAMLDEELLSMTKEEERILITNDKDFGEQIFLQKRQSAGIILFRLKEQETRKKINIMNKLLVNYQDKLLNHFVVITEQKIRFIDMEGVL